MAGTAFCIPGISSTACRTKILYSVKLIPQVKKLIIGMMTSHTRELTILPKAQPITTHTARSMTLPRIANDLNSSIIDDIKEKE